MPARITPDALARVAREANAAIASVRRLDSTPDTAERFRKGDRVFIQPVDRWHVGPYGGMWATVAKSQTCHSEPLTTVIPDGFRYRHGYTVKTASLVKGSAIAVRPRGVVAK